MLLAALVLLQTPIRQIGVWRAYDEVFDLARVDGAVVAATDGGLLRQSAGHWQALTAPAMEREIVASSPLTVASADGKIITWNGSSWAPGDRPASRSRSLEQGLILRGAEDWSPATFGAPVPPATPYCAIVDHGQLLAGTSGGLYAWAGGQWMRQMLPSDSPVVRPNGMVSCGGKYVVGGLGGLYIGSPGAWTQVSTEAVRQVAKQGTDVWVIYGNGAVDKLDPSADRLYPDVWYGAARRPWTACVSEVGSQLEFGGQGGWIERSSAMAEKYPAQLQGDIVNAMAGRGSIRWVGTEKSGLFRYGSGSPRQWNPGNGLSDPNVSALCLDPPRGLVVGTATQGLFRLDGNRVSACSSPTMRITKLSLWHDRLVVGGMDGAWIECGNSWEKLPTDGEETTALTVLDDGSLAVATAEGIHFLQDLAS